MYVLAPHISLLRSFKSCFGILFYKYLVPPGPRTQTTEKTIGPKIPRHQTRRSYPCLSDHSDFLKQDFQNRERS